MRASRRGLAAALLVACLALFAQTVRFDFVELDDQVHVWRNPWIADASWASLGYFWTHLHQRMYIPVSYSTWWLLARASPAPWIFHLANVLLHAVNTLLVFAIISRLGARRPAAAIGALIFALHPLQVECVAWVSGLRDLSSALLALAAVERYCACATRQARSWAFAGAGALFALAMLAKPSAACVPLIVIVLHRAAPERLGAPRWRILGGALLMALAIACTAKLGQADGDLAFVTPCAWRPLIALDAIGFYLGKLIIPWHLGLDYGRTPESVIARGWLQPYAAIAVAVAALCWLRPALRRWRAPLALFVVALAPVSGLVPFSFQGFSTTADRYLYLSMLGVGWAVALAVEAHGREILAATLAGACGLAALTVAQTRHWRSGPALFAHGAAVNRSSWLMEHCLGAALGRRNQLADAVEHLRHAVALRPSAGVVHADLALTLALSGRDAEAETEFARALALPDAPAAAYRDFGVLLTRERRYAEAMLAFERAVDMDPLDRDAARSLRVLRRHLHL